ncbi:uncharacterized protein FIESC28_00851 [Fusarium coffeatum]|uniref:Uncharacterized protein n=1 Tax=Fusarium coffeatum TaxID=231269 RepID=A0A366SAJ7_9HYPO|nr:uncharacterized protein FIESC28_00851 [Fusarium coffeatum]RBR26351.1 hypothetical protein FIESC28_00851 [Fusarium coffeatum]
MNDSFHESQQASGSRGASINNLPNEILREIFCYAMMNDPLPRRYRPGAAGDIQPDARQWKTAMAKSQATAHAISLVSRQFNENAKPFFFRDILLVRNELDIRDWAEKPDSPAYGKYCRSLCLVSSRVWVPPTTENGEIESDDSETQWETFSNRSRFAYPEHSILYDIYALLDNVIDFQIHCDRTIGTPYFAVAFSLLPAISIIRITGQEAAGTVPFTRLLTSPEMGTRQLEILLAWPKRLERLALQTNKQRLSDDVDRGTLQKPLDVVKDNLKQLRIEGDDELGLGGFDLRTFPCLEHVALCTATISNYNQNPRNGTKLPELDLHIFAPRLRSLLWVLPWWEQKQPKVKDFFGKRHEDRLRGLLQKAVEVKRAREGEGKEWCFERVWLETIRAPLETLEQKARRNFEKDLKRIKDLDDEFKGEGIRVRHLPFPRASTNAERRFPRLEEVWDWDEEALRRCEV